MFFQVEQIILWPVNPKFKPRTVKFELGRTNVITGASRTGKSAIIPIIDYCLGAEKCTIPVNTIRDNCSWFGALIRTRQGQKLFARREPGDLRATGDMFVIEGDQVTIPDAIPGKNQTVDGAKALLNEIAGLSSLDFDPDQLGVGFHGRPSFRDMMPFVFQPQNIVANPNVLFYKADTFEHREKLKTIFPYVLDAITPQLLAKRHELSQLKKELRRKRNELSAISEVTERWLAEIRAHAVQARENGLLSEPVSPSASLDQLIDLLRAAIRVPIESARVSMETLGEVADELVRVRSEEDTVAQQLASLQQRFTHMSSLREGTRQYNGALQIQRDRLKVAEWLQNEYEANHECPMCGTDLADADSELGGLVDAVKRIEQTLASVEAMPVALDREYERVRSALRLNTDRLEALRIRKRALLSTSQSARQAQNASASVARFVGRVEQALTMYVRLGVDQSLSGEVQELEQQIAVLERELSEAGIRAATDRALRIVNLNAGRLIPFLDVENPNDPVRLSIDELTVGVTNKDREDFLWEIGSGSNWLSYHVAVTLALQQFFLSLAHSPVPGFVVFDQPSQVYFPSRLVSHGNNDEDPQLNDEDVEAVRKIFITISDLVLGANGNMQSIILDHAANNVWGDVNGVDETEEWRHGKKLVPGEWLV